jgi:hypothetical protein
MRTLLCTAIVMAVVLQAASQSIQHETHFDEAHAPDDAGDAGSHAVADTRAGSQAATSAIASGLSASTVEIVLSEDEFIHRLDGKAVERVRGVLCAFLHKASAGLCCPPLILSSKTA